MKTLAVVSALVLTVACGASLKSVLRTIDDIATGACMIFATNNPAEFKEFALTQMNEAQAASASASGFDPKMLCGIKEVLQPFIDGQLELQQDTKVSITAQLGEADAPVAE